VIFRFSKWIALLIAAFVISANLDNIPDCPELLNPSNGAFLSLHLPHHLDTIAHPEVPYASFFFSIHRLLINGDSVLDALFVPASSIPRSLYRASDPSPPLVSVVPA
jgi:hypothetical protein